MAANKEPHRAIAIGLAGGVGLTLPLVAYVATLPFDMANDMVRASGLPFALGALAGAGVYALATRPASRRADESPAASADAEPAPEVPQWAADSEAHSFDPGKTGFLRRRNPAPDVPVIARAMDAMSEEEAWAEIDSLMSDGSPISCDARTSKDIYQIALEELARAAAQPASAAPAADASTTVSAAADPDATVSVAVDASATVASEPVAAPGTNGAAAPVSASVTTAMSADELDLDEPSGVLAGAKDTAESVTPTGPAAPAACDEAAVEVPVADYTGHEEMWALALAVLAEDELDEEPAYLGAHAAPSGPRARAIEEGRRATSMHSRVNEILGEEFDKIDSQSMRHTSHEYLRVIQGGTASMPRIQAEA